MSWDVYAFIPPHGARSIADVPNDYEPPEIGSRDEVVASIRTVAPHVDSSDPTWLNIAGSDHVIEVSLADERPRGLTFFVRGGSESVPMLMRLVTTLGLVAVDTSTGEFMTAASGTESFKDWHAFRDQVVGDDGA